MHGISPRLVFKMGAYNQNIDKQLTLKLVKLGKAASFALPEPYSDFITATLHPCIIV